ncbi:hypothetical protein TrRE_jg7370 [Triparma retinervis]|uniref:Uncharacterized protein n=1 Tax=Triparma retinervis TaxID=2557542 RepID=A0A9W7DWT1_9STRA|nr:hypothetical protein TrRE_jg7370 [Triparma retinervis]
MNILNVLTLLLAMPLVKAWSPDEGQGKGKYQPSLVVGGQVVIALNQSTSLASPFVEIIEDFECVLPLVSLEEDVAVAGFQVVTGGPIAGSKGTSFSYSCPYFAENSPVFTSGPILGDMFEEATGSIGLLGSAIFTSGDVIGDFRVSALPAGTLGEQQKFVQFQIVGSYVKDQDGGEVVLYDVIVQNLQVKANYVGFQLGVLLKVAGEFAQRIERSSRGVMGVKGEVKAEDVVGQEVGLGFIDITSTKEGVATLGRGTFFCCFGVT